jgi:hypothetical protein
MGKFTTAQLQNALIDLYKRNDADAVAAYRMTFDELALRMGDESFDAWCETAGI